MAPMGRRLIGGALVGIGLVVASMAWAGYSASRTVLDPGRSQAIADDLYNDREVRDQLRSSMASALGAALPDGVRVNRAELVAAADRALDDPAVESLLLGGLIRSHQRFLGDDPNPDEPIVIDGSAMARASREALINVRPDLFDVVPEPPSIPVELPVDRLPNASGFRTWLNGMVAMAAAVAVGLVIAAFVLTNNRPAILRRVGFWAIGAAMFWIVLGYVLPELAHLLIPGQAAILGGMWGVAAGGMLDPSKTALIAGVVAVVFSYVWVGVAALAGRSSRPPRSAREPVHHAQPVPRAEPMQYAQPVSQTQPPPYAQPTHHAQPAPPVRTTGPVTPPQGTPAVHQPRPFPAPPAQPQAAPAPRWIEGVGYVDDEPDPTRSGDSPT